MYGNFQLLERIKSNQLGGEFHTTGTEIIQAGFVAVLKIKSSRLLYQVFDLFRDLFKAS
jgi:hypothetical protein